MKNFKGGTAVITGAASGFGLEASRIAAGLGMNVVMADVQQDALDAAVAEIKGLGAQVLPFRLDVAKAAEVEVMGAATFERFGAPNFVFNNAGVGGGGLIWEHTLKDWEWIVGVNLMGVAHGVRVFTPMMLDAAKKNPAYEGHIVNTASMAGMLNAPNMGAYNVTKHAVVSLSETLYQDLRLVTDQIGASVLCPYFVPTGIDTSHRNRPADLQAHAKPTKSQLIAQAMSTKAVSSGRITAATIAQFVFDAMAESRFYVFSHPHALGGVQTRLEDVMNSRNPTDPFAQKPELGEQLRAALRSADRSTAELERLQRAPGVGVQHHQVHLLRVRRIDRHVGAELQLYRHAGRCRPGRHGLKLAHDVVVLQGHADVLTGFHRSDMPVFRDGPVSGQARVGE